jgi:hypothetical protein
MAQPVAREFDTPLICFTDQAVDPGTGWEVRPLESMLPADPHRSARWGKMHPHVLLPDFDTSFYIDNSILLTADPAPLFDRFLPPDAGMAGFAHSYRETVRDEFEEVLRLQKEAPWICEEQLEAYEATDPEALELRPIAAGFLFRRHADPVVQRAMDLWWFNVLRYSGRDQLSIHLACRQAGLKVLVHEVDNFLSDFHEWPRLAARVEGVETPLNLRPERRIAALEERIAELEAALAKLDHDRHADQLAHQRALHDQGLEIWDEVHRSMSWRVTEPLRLASEALRRRRHESS